MKTKIESLLKSVLPSKTFIQVQKYKQCFGGEAIKIAFAVADVHMNDVSGQRPQVVSLKLELCDMELTLQVYGGNGGGRIYRKPNMDDPQEKYLAMKNIKIPFRRPKKGEKFVLNAIKKFAENWLLAIELNKDQLCYQEYVNYDEFLKS